jgi:menaquinone-dependent protoporphyrinogen oxidase
MTVAIVYGTDHGQTAKVAEFIAQTLRQEELDVDVIDGHVLPSTFSISSYDAVIVGASVHSGRFQSYISKFVKNHVDEIQRKPSAFFSVSMTEADPVAHARAMNPINRFLRNTGWHPDMVTSIAGSMAYLSRRWLMRVIYRRIPLPDKRESDPSYEYTDWDAVDRFAREFAVIVRSKQLEASPV